MYQTVTRNIEVSVTPHISRSALAESNEYFWTYTIENQ